MAVGKAMSTLRLSRGLEFDNETYLIQLVRFSTPGLTLHSFKATSPPPLLWTMGTSLSPRPWNLISLLLKAPPRGTLSPCVCWKRAAIPTIMRRNCPSLVNPILLTTSAVWGEDCLYTPEDTRPGFTTILLLWGISENNIMFHGE